MSNIYLCIGERAETPYYVQESGIRLYAVEELCFYLVENIHILEQSIMCRELTDWLAKECRLDELADKLNGLLKRSASMREFVTSILLYVHYTDDEHLQEIGNILEKSVSMNHFQKRRLRADYCFRSRHYDKALNMYMQLLSETNKNNFEVAAKLYHNIGTIYSIKFEFAKAAEAYLSAYQINGSIESRRSYIMAKQLELPQSDFRKFCANRVDWEEDIRWAEVTLQHAMKKWSGTEEFSRIKYIVSGDEKRDPQYYANIEQYLQQKKDEYRKQYE